MAYDGSLVFDTSLDTSGFKSSLSSLSTIASGLGGLDNFCSKLLSLSDASIKAVSSLSLLSNQSFITQNSFAAAFNTSAIITAVQNSITSIMGLLQGAANSEQILFAGQNIINTIASGVSGNTALLQAVSSTIANTKNTAVTSVVSSSFSSVGFQIVNGIASGILSGASGVISAIISVVSSAINAAKQVAQIHSPSRVFDTQIGRMMMIGLENGIDYGAKNVSSALKNNMKDITNSALKFTSKHYQNALNSNFSGLFSDKNLSFGANLTSALNTQALKKQADSIVSLMNSGVANANLHLIKSAIGAYGPNTHGKTNTQEQVTNLYMTVNTHDSLSESELTRQAENFLARTRRKLP